MRCSLSRARARVRTQSHSHTHTTPQAAEKKAQQLLAKVEERDASIAQLKEAIQ